MHLQPLTDESKKFGDVFGYYRVLNSARLSRCVDHRQQPGAGWQPAFDIGALAVLDVVAGTHVGVDRDAAAAGRGE